MYKRINIQKKEDSGTLVAGVFLRGDGLNKKILIWKEMEERKYPVSGLKHKKYATADVSVAYEFRTIWFEKIK